jgi:hypothetical protein
LRSMRTTKDFLSKALANVTPPDPPSKEEEDEEEEKFRRSTGLSSEEGGWRWG